ncbi:MAG TPA: hypothetical protein EYO73_05000 [Sulfurimonas sp.]|nr:hypothetical protein [Sulfurimonas sp.]
MPLFISTTDPLSQKKFERIVFAHDTGGAIKGESRIISFMQEERMQLKRRDNEKNFKSKDTCT